MNLFACDSASKKVVCVFSGVSEEVNPFFMGLLKMSGTPQLCASHAFAPVFGLCLEERGIYPCGSASIFVSYSVHLRCAVKGITA